MTPHGIFFTREKKSLGDSEPLRRSSLEVVRKSLKGCTVFYSLIGHNYPGFYFSRLNSRLNCHVRLSLLFFLYAQRQVLCKSRFSSDLSGDICHFHMKWKLLSREKKEHGLFALDLQMTKVRGQMLFEAWSLEPQVLSVRKARWDQNMHCKASMLLLGFGFFAKYVRKLKVEPDLKGSMRSEHT